MLTEFRLALRSLLRHAGFTFAAVATFAIGIGANATVFGVVNAVLLKAYPFAEPDRLVALYERDTRAVGGNGRMPLSPANFRDWQAGARALSGAAAIGNADYTLREPERPDGEPTRLLGSRVSWNLPRVLGVTPVVGRAFAAADDHPGAAPVAIISHQLWQSRFGGERGVVGRSVELNGRPTTIVGVLPEAVRYPNARTDVWTPFAMSDSAWMAQRGAHQFDAVGRLAPGATLEQAQAELSTVAARIARDFPQEQTGFGATVLPFHQAATGTVAPVLWVLLGAVSFVLLIACANVANLTLARGAARQREVAVRTAIGASRWHLVRQQLAESVVLGVGGGAIGLVLAAWACRALPAIVPTSIPRLEQAGVDWRVALFTFATALVASVAAGLVPALQTARADLNGVLKDGGKGSTAGASRARTRDALFVAEVAFALLLLVGAGLTLTSFGRLLAVQPGFQPERVLTAQVSLPRARYASDTLQARFWEQLLPRLRGVPGVAGAAVVTTAPLGGGMAMWTYTVDGRPRPRANEGPVAIVYSASDDYFRTLGVPLRRGRAFTSADRLGATPVAMVSERLVREQFRDREALGQRLRFDSAGPAYEIVGVVGDVKHTSLADDVRPALYTPMSQAPWGRGTLVLRGTGDAATLAAAVRREVAALDPTLAVAEVRPMAGVVAQSVARPRFSALLLGAFAACALVLALVGIYGVVANTVAQRRGEFGIRVALGARPADVIRDVLGGSLKRAGLGVALGLAGAAALTRFLAPELYDTSPFDPPVLAGVSLLIVLVTAVASWVPAWRATRVDPIKVLRTE
jgi:putative ABC transport system permease protein